MLTNTIEGKQFRCFPLDASSYLLKFPQELICETLALRFFCTLFVSKSMASAEKTTTENNDKDSGFECNICLETARNAVLSLCGHLFCWPCIYQWLETRAHNSTCPVCKSSISREKCIPIYGRNSPRTDPRDTVPPRPAGTRQEPNRNRNFGFGDGVNFQMSFGVGAFPFGLFQTNFTTNNTDSTSNPPSPNTPDRYQSELLSRIFLGIALAVILFIIFN